MVRPDAVAAGKNEFMKTIHIAELQNLIGRETGVSDWVLIDQGRIDRFAGVTDDEQFIHVDPVRAKKTAFGGTIAHGFLSLSLLSKFAFEATPPLIGSTLSVNYGFDRVRMLSPVACGSRIRGRYVLKHMEAKSPRRLLLAFDVTVEIEHSEKPALIAEWLVMHELNSDLERADIPDTARMRL